MNELAEAKVMSLPCIGGSGKTAPLPVLPLLLSQADLHRQVEREKELAEAEGRIKAEHTCFPSASIQMPCCLSLFAAF